MSTVWIGDQLPYVVICRGGIKHKNILENEVCLAVSLHVNVTHLFKSCVKKMHDRYVHVMNVEFSVHITKTSITNGSDSLKKNHQK